MRNSKRNGFLRSSKLNAIITDTEVKKTGEIFIYRKTDDVLCTTCSQANIGIEFRAAKKMKNKFKLDTPTTE
jgi:hypothetical protein